MSKVSIGDIEKLLEKLIISEKFSDDEIYNIIKNEIVSESMGGSLAHRSGVKEFLSELWKIIKISNKSSRKLALRHI